MAAPRLSMRSLVVVDAPSSVRHALRPVVRRRRRICLCPNGAEAPGGCSPPSLSMPLMSSGVCVCVRYL
eukprot:5244631-Pyramimonas_sp.AAC.1